MEKIPVTVKDFKPPPELEPIIVFEDLIWNIDSENFDKNSKQILIYINTNEDISLNYFTLVYLNCKLRRPNKQSVLQNLFDLITKEHSIIDYPVITNPNLKYYEEAFEDPIFEMIRKDDVQSVSLQIKSVQNKIWNCFFRPKKVTTYELMISEACKYSAVNTFNYLIMCKFPITRKVCRNAIRSGCPEILQILKALNIVFENMYFEALQGHHDDIADWLYENFNNKKLDMHKLLLSGNLRAALAWSEKMFDKSFEIISFAGSIESPSLVKYFYEKGSDVNPQWTDEPLNFILRNDNIELFKLVIDRALELSHDKEQCARIMEGVIHFNAVKIFKFFIEYDMDLNFPMLHRSDERSLLAIACMDADIEIIDALIKKGANVETFIREITEDDANVRILDCKITGNALAIACQRGDPEIVKLLLNNGAEPNWDRIMIQKEIHHSFISIGMLEHAILTCVKCLLLLLQLKIVISKLLRFLLKLEPDLKNHTLKLIL